MFDLLHLEVFQQPSVHALRVRNGAVPSSSWKVRDRKAEVWMTLATPSTFKHVAWKWWLPKGISFSRGWFSGFYVKLQGGGQFGTTNFFGSQFFCWRRWIFLNGFHCCWFPEIPSGYTVYPCHTSPYLEHAASLLGNEILIGPSMDHFFLLERSLDGNQPLESDHLQHACWPRVPLPDCLPCELTV